MCMQAKTEQRLKCNVKPPNYNFQWALLTTPWNQSLASVLRHSWDDHSRSSAPRPPDWRERSSRHPSHWCWTPGCSRAFLVQTPGGEERQGRDSVEAYLQVLSVHVTDSTFLPMTRGCTSECSTIPWHLRVRRHKHVSDDSRRVKENCCRCLSCHTAQQVGVSQNWMCLLPSGASTGRECNSRALARVTEAVWLFTR